MEKIGYHTSYKFGMGVYVVFVIGKTSATLPEFGSFIVRS